MRVHEPKPPQNYKKYKSEISKTYLDYLRESEYSKELKERGRLEFIKKQQETLIPCHL